MNYELKKCANSKNGILRFSWYALKIMNYELCTMN